MTIKASELAKMYANEHSFFPLLSIRITVPSLRGILGHVNIHFQMPGHLSTSPGRNKNEQTMSLL